MATRTDGSGVGGALKRILVGRALSTSAQEHQLLPKTLALPVFSSDPLSSVAYATEEMMLVLVTAGVAALSYRLPIALAIAALLAIVVTSYRQTVRAYPRGGGSYIVARENLGTVPGLVAAAAILTDYILTVAVSRDGWDRRDHVGSAVDGGAQGVARVTPRRVRDGGEPARRERGGSVLRAPDLRVRRDRRTHDRPGLLAMSVGLPRRRHVHAAHRTDHGGDTRSCCFERSPPARPPLPASRRSPTVCRRSVGRRRRTQRPRSR